jgi:hypothetical protein
MPEAFQTLNPKTDYNKIMGNLLVAQALRIGTDP